MIMMIYYLKTTNEGKSFALLELKNNLMSEREDFKKRMAQRAAKDDVLSGRKSQLQGGMTRRGSQIRRASYEKIISSRRPSLSFQPSLAPSVGGMSGLKSDHSQSSSSHPGESDRQILQNPHERLNRQMTNSNYPVGYNPNRRMSNTSVNSSTDPDSDNHTHQRQMLRVARRWSHAAAAAQRGQFRDFSGTESDQGGNGFRTRVSRRKSHFDKADCRELNDLKETSPNEPINKRSQESLVEEENESETFSGNIELDSESGELKLDMPVERSRRASPRLTNSRHLTSSPQQGSPRRQKSPYISQRRKSNQPRCGGGPSTSDSDSTGTTKQLRQMSNMKTKLRPSSRQNFKISRPQSRSQMHQRRLSPHQMTPKKKKSENEKSDSAPSGE